MEFIQAKNYRKGPEEPILREVNLIVLHSMESQEKPDVARNVALWFAGKPGPAPMASAHFCCGGRDYIQCVRLNDIAYHAAGANSKSVGIELGGRASQTFEQWQDAYSSQTLMTAARVVAYLSKRYTIPLIFLRTPQLLQGARGITTHLQVSDAFKKSNHHDPGPGFPLALFLELCGQAKMFSDLEELLGEVR